MKTIDVPEHLQSAFNLIEETEGPSAAIRWLKTQPKRLMKPLTMSEIRQNNIDAGFHTFDRKTLRFFGETMANWKAGPLQPNGMQLIYRTGGKAGNKTMLYNPVTHRVTAKQEEPTQSTIKTRYFSSHFVSYSSAIRYYKAYGCKPADVSRKIQAGEIHLGQPRNLPAGQTIEGVNDEGRYVISQEATP